MKIEKGVSMKSWKVYVFVAVLAIAAVAQLVTISSTVLRMGKPLVSPDGEIYVVQVAYGNERYFAACFDSPDQLASFVRLGSVTVWR